MRDNKIKKELIKNKIIIMKLEKLFNPVSIAIVGASKEDGKVGNVIAKNLLNIGYAGEVFLVNPKHETMFGRKCYASLGEIECEIDLAILAIPAKFVNSEIENNAAKIKNYVVISAGFSETDVAGKMREKELARIAKDNELNILGPNCLGFIIPALQLNASFAGGMPQKGNVSFVSQSGALAVALMDIAEKEKIGFSNIISVGNKMQLDEAELLEYLAKDENTKVIGMYLEGIKNGERFNAVSRAVSSEKPVIILKAGKNTKTQKAIASHTGALAGDDDVISAVFKKNGVMRANNLEEFFNLFNLIRNSAAPQERGSVVVTNAGGVGVLTADAMTGKTIELVDITDRQKKELREFLPPESSVSNPIDLLGDAQADRYAKTLKVVAAAKNVGSIICVLTPQDQTPVEEIAQIIIDFKKKTDKTIVTVFLGGTRIEAAVLKLEENGICNFDFPDQAVLALDEYFSWQEFRKRKMKNHAQIVNVRRQERVLAMIEKAGADGRTALYFSESARVMEMYGVNTPEYQEIFPEDGTSARKRLKFKGDMKFPVVLKVDSDQVLHKTDKQGLILGIENEKELRAAIKKVQLNFTGARLIIQPMAARGTELIVGIKRDPNFGPVLVYGLGGIYTEILHRVDYLVPPLSLPQIESSLGNGKLGFLFAGARGQREYDVEELARVLQGIMLMSLEIPEIREFDINPILVYNDSRKALAVDVKIVI